MSSTEETVTTFTGAIADAIKSVAEQGLASDKALLEAVTAIVVKVTAIEERLATLEARSKPGPKPTFAKRVDEEWATQQAEKIRLRLASQPDAPSEEEWASILKEGEGSKEGT